MKSITAIFLRFLKSVIFLASDIKAIDAIVCIFNFYIILSSEEAFEVLFVSLSQVNNFVYVKL